MTMDTFLAILPYVGSAVGGLIGKIVFDWLKDLRKKKINGTGTSASKVVLQRTLDEINSNLETLETNVLWLKERHDKYDENGTPLWYVPRDLKRYLVVSRERDAQQIELLNHVVSEVKEHRNLLWDLLKRRE